VKLAYINVEFQKFSVDELLDPHLKEMRGEGMGEWELPPN
jgi:hypothetical protein